MAEDVTPETTTESSEGSSDQVEAKVSNTDTSEASNEEGDLGVKVDLTEVPEKLRPDVEKLAKKYELDFKRAYTKKTQEMSAKERQRTYEVEQYRQQVEGYQRIAREVMEDPSKLDAYRKLYGVKGQPERVTSVPPEIKTVDELLSHLDTRYNSQLQELRQELTQQSIQQIQRHQQIARWDSGLKEMRVGDPKFSKYENVIVKLASSDPRYQALYTGDNEVEVLKTVTNDFKALMREDLDEVKKTTLAEMQKKKTASTQSPAGRRVATESTLVGATPDEVIARVRARLGTLD